MSATANTPRSRSLSEYTGSGPQSSRDSARTEHRRAGGRTGSSGLRLATLLGPLPGRLSDAGPARDIQLPKCATLHAVPPNKSAHGDRLDPPEPGQYLVRRQPEMSIFDSACDIKPGSISRWAGIRKPSR